MYMNKRIFSLITLHYNKLLRIIAQFNINDLRKNIISFTYDQFKTDSFIRNRVRLYHIGRINKII